MDRSSNGELKGGLGSDVPLGDRTAFHQVKLKGLAELSASSVPHQCTDAHTCAHTCTHSRHPPRPSGTCPASHMPSPACPLLLLMLSRKHPLPVSTQQHSFGFSRPLCYGPPLPRNLPTPFLPEPSVALGGYLLTSLLYMGTGICQCLPPDLRKKNEPLSFSFLTLKLGIIPVLGLPGGLSEFRRVERCRGAWLQQPSRKHWLPVSPVPYRGPWLFLSTFGDEEAEHTEVKCMSQGRRAPE